MSISQREEITGLSRPTIPVHGGSLGPRACSLWEQQAPSELLCWLRCLGQQGWLRCLGQQASYTAIMHLRPVKVDSALLGTSQAFSLSSKGHHCKMSQDTFRKVTCSPQEGKFLKLRAARSPSLNTAVNLSSPWTWPAPSTQEGIPRLPQLKPSSFQTSVNNCALARREDGICTKRGCCACE